MYGQALDNTISQIPGRPRGGGILESKLKILRVGEMASLVCNSREGHSGEFGHKFTIWG